VNFDANDFVLLLSLSRKLDELLIFSEKALILEKILALVSNFFEKKKIYI
jgi:hypothetical protein